MIKLLMLSITSRCNLNCKYCYVKRENKDMNFEVAKRAIDLVIKSNPYFFRILFTGGEPLLRVEFLEKVIKYAISKSKEVGFQIQTNGTLINDEIIKIMKKYEIQVGVSLDGIPKINDLQRGKSKEVIEGLEKLKEHKITIGVTCVLTSINIEYLTEFIEFLDNFENVYAVGFDILKKKYGNLSPPSLDQINLIISSYKKARRIKFREIESAKFLILKKIPRYKYCFGCSLKTIYVDPEGDLYPCASFDQDKRFFLGNIFEISSFEEVLIKSPLKERDARFMKKCSNCEYNILCGGGCPARSFYNEGDLFIPDKIECEFKKLIFSHLFSKSEE